MSTRANHSPDIRAAAVAALLAGQSVSAVAKEYKLPKGTVSSWKKRTQVDLSATQKEDGKSIGELLVDLLTANLRGLISASSILQDREWVKQQGAAELGTFIGITHDKVIRMLEAMDRSAPPLDNSNAASAE